MPGPWDAKTKVQVARTNLMRVIYNYWWAAGRKVGLTKEDILRKVEAE